MDRYKGWRQMLQTAANTQAVNAIMADYIRSIGPLADCLPEDCQMAFGHGLDIQTAAVTLLQAELRFQGPHEAREFLHEVAHTFASAAVRLTLLHPSQATAATD